MKKLCLILSVLAMILCFAGCKQTQNEEIVVPTEPVELTTEPVPDALQVYMDALQPYDDAKIEVEFERQMQLADQSFSEEYQYTLQYKNLDTDDFCAMVNGEIDFGYNDTISVDERYKDGMVYGFMDEFGYNAESTQDVFFSRYIPAVALDASLYGTVDFVDENTISFSDAAGLETWLQQDGYEFIDASGTASISEDGILSGFTYSAVYSYGAAEIAVEYKTQFSQDDISVLPPDRYAAKMAVYDANIPIIIQRARGYLMQSDVFSITTGETVISEALGIYYQGEISTDLHYKDELLYSNHSVIQVSDLQGIDVATHTFDELYRDGTFLYFEDGQQHEDVDVYTADIVDFAKSTRSLYFPSLMDIDELYISLVPGGIVLDYIPNSAFETRLRTDIVEMLTGDMNAVERHSSKYTPQRAEGYLAIDIYTGLPTAMGMTYSGMHTIDGVEQELAMSAARVVDGASLDAYTTITGEALPIQQELAQPTPAFYQVSGSDGQQMWLMGTIHLGDVRTTNLPEEIYEALADADALAVEFDVEDFSEQMLTDSALAAEVYRAYYYQDGSTIDAHLDMPELFETALQTLKLTGNTLGPVLLAKPIVWSQAIEDYYVRRGYQFSADYGVDTQLLELAQEQEKTILNVESGIEQLQFLGGYSDGVQQMILADTLSSDPALYNDQLEEMFELWCKGDEAELREFMKTDTSQMTAEELELYQEYTKAMETDRNIQMLEVAKEYLESGETVFYAVGLAHLLAEDGLVNTLRQAGYTVEQVTYS